MSALLMSAVFKVASEHSVLEGLGTITLPAKWKAAAEAAIDEVVIFCTTSSSPVPEADRGNYVGAAHLVDIRPSHSTPFAVDCYFQDYEAFPIGVASFDGIRHERRAREPQWSSLRQRPVRPLDPDECIEILDDALRESMVHGEEPDASADEPDRYAPTATGRAQVHGYSFAQLESLERSYKAIRRLRRSASIRLKTGMIYDWTCCMTGARQMYPDGRFEGASAHIVPVADEGPDMLPNMLFLTTSIHALYDNGILALSEDYGILLHASLMDPVIRRMLHADMRARVPDDPALRPSPIYLRQHRIRHGFEP